ncbi:hypothetical protein [Undibacterium sp. 5I1]
MVVAHGLIQQCAVVGIEGDRCGQATHAAAAVGGFCRGCIPKLSS